MTVRQSVLGALKLIFSLAALTLLVFNSAVTAQVSKPGVITYDVDSGGPFAGSDYYGSGNDDAFGEYGLTTFNFSAADFGGAVSEIQSAVLTLTVNDRTFSDGDAVEFFYTPDTGADLDSGLMGDFSDLSFNDMFVNGIDATQFVTAPESLGVFSIPEMAGRPGGEVDSFSLNFSPGATTSLLSAINSGSDFQILIGATVDTHDITYSGVGNTFDPGDPTLTITVPEPSALSLLFVGLLPFLRRRR